jgi:hypothetical protein
MPTVAKYPSNGSPSRDGHGAIGDSDAEYSYIESQPSSIAHGWVQGHRGRQSIDRSSAGPESDVTGHETDTSAYSDSDTESDEDFSGDRSKFALHLPRSPAPIIDTELVIDGLDLANTVSYVSVVFKSDIRQLTSKVYIESSR